MQGLSAFWGLVGTLNTSSVVTLITLLFIGGFFAQLLSKHKDPVAVFFILILLALMYLSANICGYLFFNKDRTATFPKNYKFSGSFDTAEITFEIDKIPEELIKACNIELENWESKSKTEVENIIESFITRCQKTSTLCDIDILPEHFRKIKITGLAYLNLKGEKRSFLDIGYVADNDSKFYLTLSFENRHGGQYNIYILLKKKPYYSPKTSFDYNTIITGGTMYMYGNYSLYLMTPTKEELICDHIIGVTSLRYDHFLLDMRLDKAVFFHENEKTNRAVPLGVGNYESLERD